MRNLKKALALVLALMMTLSLMVTASATDYADDGKIKQDEAVSVMSALGVFQGKGENDFDPEGSLTRAEAAKIITYMLVGKTVADALPNTGSKFTDCRDGKWYVGVVNYLTDRGIINGRNDTTFDPSGKVKGYEFAKMLLGALGYDAKNEKFTNDSSWEVNVAVCARQAGLDKGLTTGAVSSAFLTREQAATLAFNTLTADMVYYEGGTDLTTPDGTAIVVGGTRKTMANNGGTTAQYDGSANTTMQFCEMFFPELKFTNAPTTTADDFGRTISAQWTVGDDTAYTDAAKPTVTYTSATTAATIEKDLKGYSAYVAGTPNTVTAVNAAASVTTTTKLYAKGGSATDKLSTVNGTATDVANGEASTKKVSEVLAALTGNGKKVEIYTDKVGSDEKMISAIVVTEYTVEQVKNIVEKNGETSYSFTVTTPGTSYKNNEDATNVILHGTVAKDDVVTTAKTGSKIHVWPTTKFTGSQTAKKGNTVTIGGADYVVATGVKNAAAATVDADDFGNNAKEQTYWADVNGYLVKVEGEAPAAPQYAVIVKTLAGKSGTATLDNPSKYTVNVRAILADGQVKDFTLATKESNGVNNGATSWDGDTLADGDLFCGKVKLCVKNNKEGSLQTDVDNVLEGELFSYTLDGDKMVLGKKLTAGTSDLGTANTVNLVGLDGYNGTNKATGASGTIYGSAANQSSINVLFTKDTKFVLYHASGSTWKTEEVKTGLANLKVSDADGFALVSATTDSAQTGEASLVFLNATTVAEQPADQYIFIDASEFTNVLLDDGKSTDKWVGVLPDGTTKEVTGNHASITADGLYLYGNDGKLGAAKVTTNTPLTTTLSNNQTYAFVKAAAKTNNLIKVGDDYLNIVDDTKIVYNGDLDEINGKDCFVVMKPVASGAKPTTISAIYVYSATKDVATIASLTASSQTVTVSGATGTATIASLKKGEGKVTFAATVTGGELKVTPVDGAANLQADGNTANSWVLKSDASLTSGDTLTFKVTVAPDATHLAPSEVLVTVTVTAVTDA